MKEINIDVVRGYYEETHAASCASPVNDSVGIIIADASKLCEALSRTARSDSGVGLAKYRHQQRMFTSAHNQFIADDYAVNLNFVDEEDIISSGDEIGNIDVGHIFLRASMEELNALPNDAGIYLRLYAPQRSLVLMEIFPRRLAGMICADTFSASQQVRHLISVPHPVKPEQVMVVPYFDSECVKVASYQAVEKDQYYYKETGSLVHHPEKLMYSAVVIAD